MSELKVINNDVEAKIAASPKDVKRDQTFIYNPEVINGMILDGDKLMYHKDRVEAWQRGERIAPITIDWALTRACNARCTFCYAMLQQNELDELNKDTIRQSPKVIDRFLDDCAEIGVKAISLVSDGESTVHPYVYDAILRGKKNGIDMALATNGYLLKQDRLEEVLPALSYLRFNISAGTPKGFSKIMGMEEHAFYKVISNIAKAVEIKKRLNLKTTIGMQMVFMPQFKDELKPLAELGKMLGVDYLVIKHCSDDEMGSLGVNYRDYRETIPAIEEAESISTSEYKVVPKWSKLMSEGKREYQRCYGPPFILQLSGSGLVAPCGPLFSDIYKQFHIGDITEKSFKEIWESNAYWNVINHLSSKKFNAQQMCGALCLQHKVNQRLYYLKEHNIGIPDPDPAAEKPMHVNFI